jgi:hypothetical protein
MQPEQKNKKTGRLKLGIILILIGIGLPSVLFSLTDVSHYGYGGYGERRLIIISEKRPPEMVIPTIDEYYRLPKTERDKLIEENTKRKLDTSNTDEVSIPFKYFTSIGIFLVILGVGMVWLSNISSKQDNINRGNSSNNQASPGA